MVKLARFGYALNRVAPARHQALTLAMWRHGTEAVLERLVGLDDKGAHRTYYSDVIDCDIKFIRDYLEPPMPSCTLFAKASERVSSRATIVEGHHGVSDDNAQIVENASIEYAMRIHETIEMVHDRMIPAIKADDKETLDMLVNSMQILVKHL